MVEPLKKPEQKEAHKKTWGDLTMRRVKLDKGELLCELCASPEFTTADDTNVLLLVMPDSTLAFCPFHEGLLLNKLLNNYLKRIRKDQKWGYMGPLAKDFGPSFDEGVRQISLATGQENRTVKVVMQYLEDEWKGNKAPTVRVIK